MSYVSIDVDKLRSKHANIYQKPLFPHQVDAISRLDGLFSFKGNELKAGLLVIPTGGGKTFTAVKWIYDSVLPKNVKILWLAHSFHLLDQAFDTFKENALWMVGSRQSVNIRVISSNPSHCKVHQINSADDVLIMTTPTAISNFDVEGINNKGQPLMTEFKKYLNTLAHDRLLLVLDKAHHAPAYGARHLLLNLMKLIPRLYLLGLTATPTYTDETKKDGSSRYLKMGLSIQ